MLQTELNTILGLEKKEDVVSLSMEINSDLENHPPHYTKLTNFGNLLLAFKALGVIYGDIGTSPLYVYSSIFTEPPKNDDVYGVLSLIIWSLTIIPLVKYVFFVLKADDNGEGGTFALYSLIARFSGLVIRGEQRKDDLNIVNYDAVSIHSAKDKPNLIARNKRVQELLLILVALASSLVLSDGLLTPAISVLSAVEGLKVPINHMEHAVVPLSCVIIVLLFFGQRFGTDKVSSLFAPFISFWLLSLAIVGIWNLSDHPEIFKAYNPYYAFNYFTRNGPHSFYDLGGVLLAVTGVEALYADLGHFNHRSIQISFSCFVYPPLILAYMGQAARLLEESELYSNAFWSTIPQGGFIYWLIFLLAICATIIGSQAMISATFTLIHQGMQLDFFPRVQIIHTSRFHRGQIYIPEINWILMILVVIMVISFKASANLTHAYGVAVASVMLITTILLSITIRVVWNLNRIYSISFLLIFGFIDACFLGSTLNKIPDGGWFTLMFGSLLASIMLIWKWGTNLRIEYELKNKIRLSNLFMDDFDQSHTNDSVTSLTKEPSQLNLSEKVNSSIETEKGQHQVMTTAHAQDTTQNSITNITIQQVRLRSQLRLLDTGFKVQRLPGIGMFYQDSGLGVPLTFSHFIQHLPAVPETLVFISIRPVAVPYVGEEDRLVVRKVGQYEGTYRVIARYGYMEQVFQSKEFMVKLIEAIYKIDPEQDSLKPEFNPEKQVVTYVVGRQQILPNTGSWLRTKLLNFYVTLLKNSREEHAELAQLKSAGLVILHDSLPLPTFVYPSFIRDFSPIILENWIVMWVNLVKFCRISSGLDSLARIEQSAGNCPYLMTQKALTNMLTRLSPPLVRLDIKISEPYLEIAPPNYLAWIVKIKKIDIVISQSTLKLLPIFAKTCQNLKEIHIQLDLKTFEFLAHLESIIQFLRVQKQLSTLSLYHGRNLSYEDIYPILEVLPITIRHLDLRRTKFRGTKNLDVLATLKGLEIMNFQYTINMSLEVFLPLLSASLPSLRKVLYCINRPERPVVEIEDWVAKINGECRIHPK
ncbi:hypothetical protein G9A89_007262 [Geosiphon pyriformis]|nr:hypothetical protein G9A89_007262 [Geosiphon pyriformis]